MGGLNSVCPEKGGFGKVWGAALARFGVSQALLWAKSEGGTLRKEQRQVTQLLQKAFERAARLPHEEQGRFARFLLAELESEERWTELFSRPRSEELLER